MLGQIEKQLITECGLKSGDLLLLGISGGPDSLFLLDVLWRLGWPVLAAHLNHSLRPEADREAEAVCQMAERRGLSFVTEKRDVAAFARQAHLSIEEAARTVRYQFLFAQAEAHHCQAVAVAHTADDQVETVLMHLLRGAGLAGLSGMSFRQLPNPWSQQIPLVRPLLGIWRQQIEEHLQAQGLTALQDASNWDRRFYRNRLRNELIPFLTSYNPQVKTHLWRTAALARLDQAVLLQLEEQRWQECLQRGGEDFVALRLDRLQSEPTGMQLRLLRRAIAALVPGLRDIDFETSFRALAFLQQPTRSGQMDLAAGLRIFQQGELLWLARWGTEPTVTEEWPQLPAGADFALTPPADLLLAGGWHLQAVLLPCTAEALAQAAANPDPYQAWLDAEALAFPLTLRTPRPGDRFQPLGMEGHSLKLSDFWINARLPQHARGGWPLLEAGGQIAWIPGFRPAHFARLQSSTRQVCFLHLKRELPNPQPSHSSSPVP